MSSNQFDYKFSFDQSTAATPPSINVIFKTTTRSEQQKFCKQTSYSVQFVYWTSCKCYVFRNFAVNVELIYTNECIAHRERATM